jgi:hydrogenase-4 membrane subunit HyfE
VGETLKTASSINLFVELKFLLELIIRQVVDYENESLYEPTRLPALLNVLICLFAVYLTTLSVTPAM